MIVSPGGTASYTLPRNCGSKYVIELSLSCRELKNMDVLSKTDACVVVYVEQLGCTPKWKELGRTEVVDDNLNPEFSRKISLCYSPGERQRVKFRVYDVDTTNHRRRAQLKKENLVGRVKVLVSRLVEFKAFAIYEEKLFIKTDPKPRGILVVASEVIQNRREALSLQLAAANIPAKKFLRKSNSYFFELRKNMDGRQLLVYRSEHVSTSKVCSQGWKPFELKKSSLCSDDEEKVLYLSMWKVKRNGEHKLVGSRETNLIALKAAPQSKTDNIYQMSIKGTALKIIRIDDELYSTFLDTILLKGTFMHYFLAIDFSASNGQPSSTDSLHYINPRAEATLNLYQDAIHNVLEVLKGREELYDMVFPVLGFGAEVNDSKLNDEFHVNGNDDSPLCIGIDEVLQAYKSCVKRVNFQEPTNLAPIIRHVTRYAELYNNDEHYFVLIIFTDGQISDMPATIDAVVAASMFPVSIVIVGLGNGPFYRMERLDADEKSLCDSHGVRMHRDIVQFVNYSEVVEKATADLGMGQILLAREIFYEMPTQLIAASPLREVDTQALVNRSVSSVSSERRKSSIAEILASDAHHTSF